MSTREHKVMPNLRSVGRFRRVNFGRNDTKTILKNPYFKQMLLQSRRDMREGKGIEMSLEEFRRCIGLES